MVIVDYDTESYSDGLQLERLRHFISVFFLTEVITQIPRILTIRR